MYGIDDKPVIYGFKYIKVFEKGRPMHQQYDNFSMKHPMMELSRRAKIFSPFDALKGFKEAIEAVDATEERDLNSLSALNKIEC